VSHEKVKVKTVNDWVLKEIEKENLKVPKGFFINASVVVKSICLLFDDECVKGSDCAFCALCEDRKSVIYKILNKLDFEKDSP
jgi:hypothetical protein